MDKQIKTIISGLAISGVGMLLSPLFFDKVIVVINMLVFIGFTVAGMAKILESKGITIKDLDSTIEKKMSQSYQEKQYGSFFLYTSLRPLIMMILIVSCLYMVTFLIF